jgi:hypothetical protein
VQILDRAKDIIISGQLMDFLSLVLKFPSFPPRIKNS